MRKIAIGLALAIISSSASAQTHVQGHWRKDGTYVQPHVRSNPNGTRLDNWSTRPNINPYTGRQGTRNPYPNPYQSRPIQTPQPQPQYEQRRAKCAYSIYC